jgi:hypothetical protein
MENFDFGNEHIKLFKKINAGLHPLANESCSSLPFTGQYGKVADTGIPHYSTLHLALLPKSMVLQYYAADFSF